MTKLFTLIIVALFSVNAYGIKILKNNTGADITVTDAGSVVIPASSQITVPMADYYIWAESDEIVEHIGTGDVTVNDGSADLDKSEGTALMQGNSGVVINGVVNSFNTRDGAVVPATNDYTWAQVDKTTSDIADITTKSHTSLTDVGSNAHSVIDTHLGSSSNPHTVTKAQVGLTNVEDTALSTWAGSANLTTLGTISTGVWNGTALVANYVPDHDNLNNVTADEHVAHSGVTLTAGVGLLGGGDTSASRTFDFDINTLPSGTIAANDVVAFGDTDESNTVKKALVSDLVSSISAYNTIIPDAGTTQVAVGGESVKLTSSDASITVTGSSPASQDTVTFDVASPVITAQGATTVATGDLVLVADIDDSNNLKKVTTQSIADLAAGASVPGSDTEVIFNDGGSAFGADAGMTYNKTSDALTVAGDLVVDTTTLAVNGTSNMVGIGTSSPSHGLHVVNGDLQQMLLEGTVNNATMQFKNASAELWEIGLDNFDRFIVFDRTASAYRMVIDSTGEVGVGTSAPTHTMHVVGTTKLDGAVTVDSHVALDEIAAPSATAGYGKLYAKTDEELYYKDGSGTETQLTGVAGGSQNLFETFSTPAGTSPVADTTTDTLTYESGGANLTITGDSSLDKVTFAVVDAQIDHDVLTNFSTSEHYLQSAITEVGTVTTGVWSGTALVAGKVPAHDDLTGFVSGEHILHSGVTLTAGVGISGGGDISASRTFTLDASELATVTVATGDLVVIEDITDNSTKLVTAQSIADLGGGGGGTAPTIIVKPADESVTSSSTLQDDDDFTFSIAADETVVVECQLMMNNIVASPDITLQFTGPASPDSVQGAVKGMVTVTADNYGRFKAFSSSVDISGNGTAPDDYIYIYMSVINGSNAGTVTLQWAQRVANVAAVTIEKGSWMKIHRP